ncbi:hypothetical protein CNMCM5793_006479 [Aspergillus hiratsukae]|uniref:Xylanolytic transcriptional activator regulatory domain-containing protein n=1 Tax=Aspergillus hiratsukae TaxID=1194566 RepID=A0A8H6UNY5_9EURO|nr:hypothetical protein CNMCM5793_006479 [Aspergillus hiratsukae]KAF7160210.1 hypothetical protein CNMCM6106_007646 [Aspergillus hiratsukae]
MAPEVERHVGNKDFTRSTVVIIGAGISGLCTAIDLIKRGKCHNFIILEKSSGVGGTWNDNRYPGSCCDVWSSLYSYSFEQKPDWTREYPGQEEILGYLIGVAQKYGLYKHIRFNSAVEEARWDDADLKWKVRVQVSGGKDSQYLDSYEITTDFLVSAVGQLNVPHMPDIPGLDDYNGRLMHSARWDWSYDWTGKRIAVIGNGATAAQIIPEIAKTASHVSVYQRTPNWIIPRLDKPVGTLQRALLTYIPPIRWRKRALMMDFREWFFDAVVDRDSALSNMIRKTCLDAMRAQLPDRPDLWEVLTPNYSPGCKRVIISDDYYPTLGKEHVNLETRLIKRITETGIETADGVAKEFDLIVAATGFRTVEFMYPIQIKGANGRSLSDIWKDGAMAYYGVIVEDLPNFAMLYGPNTNLGHNSIILMIEAQSRYISALVSQILQAQMDGQNLALRPKPEAVTKFNEDIQAALRKSSFADPNCSSWYKTEDGRITNNWHSTVVDYQNELSSVRWDDYIAEGTGKSLIGKKKETHIGRVKEETLISNTSLLWGVASVAVALGGYYLKGSALLRGGRYDETIMYLGLITLATMEPISKKYKAAAVNAEPGWFDLEDLSAVPFIGLTKPAKLAANSSPSLNYSRITDPMRRSRKIKRGGARIPRNKRQSKSRPSASTVPTVDENDEGREEPTPSVELSWNSNNEDDIFDHFMSLGRPGAGLRSVESSVAEMEHIFDHIFGAGNENPLFSESDEPASDLLQIYGSDEDILDAYYVFIHLYYPILPPPERLPLYNRPLNVNSTFRPSSPLSLAVSAILVLIPHPEIKQPSTPEYTRLRRNVAHSFAQSALEAVEADLELLDSSSDPSRALSDGTQIIDRQPFHSKVPVPLEAVLALVILSVYEYAQRGNIRKMYNRAGQALTAAMSMSLHEMVEDDEYAEARRRAWWITYLTVCQGSIASGTPAAFNLYDPRFVTPYPEGWKLLIEAQQAILEATTFVHDLDQTVKSRFKASWISSRMTELDQQITNLLLLCRRSSLFLTVSPLDSPEKIASQTINQIAQIKLYSARIKVHRFCAFSDVPVFRKRHCDLQPECCGVESAIPSPPEDIPLPSIMKSDLPDLNFPFSSLSSSKICLQSALNIVTLVDNLPYPNPDHTIPLTLPPYLSNTSRVEIPRTMPTFACCVMQASYAMLMLYLKARSKHANSPEDLGSTKGLSTGFLTELQQNLRLVSKILANYAIAAEALQGMKEEVSHWAFLEG